MLFFRLIVPKTANLNTRKNPTLVLDQLPPQR